MLHVFCIKLIKIYISLSYINPEAITLAYNKLGMLILKLHQSGGSLLNGQNIQDKSLGLRGLLSQHNIMQIFLT